MWFQWSLHLVRGDTTVIGHQLTQVAFRNCAPFTKYIAKFDATKTDDVEDIDSVAPMYNLIEYSPNYSEIAGIVLFYSKDEGTLNLLKIRLNY